MFKDYVEKADPNLSIFKSIPELFQVLPDGYI